MLTNLFSFKQTMFYTCSFNILCPHHYSSIFKFKFIKQKHLLHHSRSLLPEFRTHSFRFFPQSLPGFEYNRIQIDDVARSMFFPNEDSQNTTVIDATPLNYSESTFRSASFPVIWLDAQGDVRWNHAAQHEMLNYLLEKQFPNDSISTCLSRQLILLEQWPWGFYSRYHCLIEQFGQSLYSPSMALLLPRRFRMENAAIDDFRGEGILRYYQSISMCSSHLSDPQLKTLRDRITSFQVNSTDTKTVTSIYHLLERDESNVRYKLSREIWTFGYEHVPHRRWLFDRNRKQTKTLVTYHSPTKDLIDHSNEHIYYYNGSSLNPVSWSPRNVPFRRPSAVLNGTTTQFTIPDRIFTSFLRYMFLLFFSQLTPRIQTSAKLLAHHWSEYLSDKYNRKYNESLSKMAAIFIRRGDKMSEDSFWQKYKRWRNISMYVKGVIDNEKRRKINYTSIFVMTQDATVMSSIQEYARDGLKGSKKDEPYARTHLYGREILYNVFSPPSCQNSFSRIGFDQFLVNIQFLTDHASLVVGHTDSNIARYLEEIIYVNRQHEPNIQTRTYVVNAPDSLN